MKQKFKDFIEFFDRFKIAYYAFRCKRVWFVGCSKDHRRNRAAYSLNESDILTSSTIDLLTKYGLENFKDFDDAIAKSDYIEIALSINKDKKYK